MINYSDIIKTNTFCFECGHELLESVHDGKEGIICEHCEQEFCNDCCNEHFDKENEWQIIK